MDRPSNEQIALSRDRVTMILDTARSGHAVRLDAAEQEALDDLLTATIPPTDVLTKQQADVEAYVAWIRARVLRTSGDVGRADVAAEEARWAAEQGDPAFVVFQGMLDANMSTVDIARRAAVAEPTDEELAEEARTWAGVEGHGASGRAARAGYKAGARREGAR